MYYIIHHTDPDGWGSAAWLVAEKGPGVCLLYPADATRDAIAILRTLQASDGDTIWVLLRMSGAAGAAFGRGFRPFWTPEAR